MILKLNTDGTIEVLPQAVPEDLRNDYLTYIFPKGLNHLRPVLLWGGQRFEGHNKYIQKANDTFAIKVQLFNGTELFKEYRLYKEPSLYIGYNVEQLEPNLLKRIQDLETENRTLKEKGDIL